VWMLSQNCRGFQPCLFWREVRFERQSIFVVR
jgi:hypothetical protein